MSTLKDKEIDAIVEASKAAQKEAVENGGIDMREVKDSVQVDESASIKHDKKAVPMDSDNPIDLIAQTIETMPNSNLDIFEVGDKDAETKNVQEHVIAEAKDNMNLSDEDAANLIDIMSKYKNDPNYPIYKNLPEAMKNTIKQIAFQNNIPANKFNQIARMFIDEMVNDAAVKEAFVDLETSLNKALNVPSISDVYSDHIRDVMEKQIPETAERIRAEAPEKAALLEKIRDNFKKSYDFSFAMEMYESNTRLRKALRRSGTEIKRSLDSFNFMNQKTKFRMNDVRELPGVLSRILILDKPTEFYVYGEDGESVPDENHPLLHMDITGLDIEKFCILITQSCSGLNPEDVADASYMYYMMRNIISLKLANEAKTPFAAELISNICKTIAFIRDKEAEFNAEHMDESQHRKKSGKSKRSKR